MPFYEIEDFRSHLRLSCLACFVFFFFPFKQNSFCAKELRLYSICFSEIFVTQAPEP